VRVEEDACYVNKLPQNVGLETWIWRQIVTSQRAHTKYKSPPYVIEWNPLHENFLRTLLNKSTIIQMQKTLQTIFRACKMRKGCDNPGRISF